MHACVCIHTSCLLEHYLFIYLFAVDVYAESSSFNLIIYHIKYFRLDQINFSGRRSNSNTPVHPHLHTGVNTHRCMCPPTHTYRQSHPHGSECMLAAVSLPGVAAAWGELCYVTYGKNMVHATANIQIEKLCVVCPW